MIHFPESNGVAILSKAVILIEQAAFQIDLHLEGPC